MFVFMMSGAKNAMNYSSHQTEGQNTLDVCVKVYKLLDSEELQYVYNMFVIVILNEY